MYNTLADNLYCDILYLLNKFVILYLCTCNLHFHSNTITVQYFTVLVPQLIAYINTNRTLREKIQQNVDHTSIPNEGSIITLLL